MAGGSHPWPWPCELCCPRQCCVSKHTPACSMCQTWKHDPPQVCATSPVPSCGGGFSDPFQSPERASWPLGAEVACSSYCTSTRPAELPLMVLSLVLIRGHVWEKVLVLPVVLSLVVRSQGDYHPSLLYLCEGHGHAVRGQQQWGGRVG